MAKNTIFQDWSANKGNVKGRVIMIHFRMANLIYSNLWLKILFCWYLFYYRLVFHWILGVELREGTVIGNSLIIHHGQSLVVHHDSVFGKGCTLRHCTTIGNKRFPDGTYSRPPIFGDNVDIGSNVIVIGPIKIGNNVSIGAGSVVVKDIPANSVVVGNPARELPKNREDVL